MNKLVVVQCFVTVLSIVINADGNTNKVESEKPAMSVWAKKAGGNWRPELITKVSEPPNPTHASITANENTDYSEELFPRERNCGRKKYWHVRGLKCVPFECPGGNKYRDRDTGDCILSQFGSGRRWWGRRQYHRRHGHYTKRPPYGRG